MSDYPGRTPNSVEQCWFGRRGGDGRGLDGGAREVGGAPVDLRDTLEPVGVLGTFVPADPLDPREAQRIAAGVAGALLDLVAGDLQHHLRRHEVNVAAARERELVEQLRKLRDLLVGDAAV